MTDKASGDLVERLERGGAPFSANDTRQAAVEIRSLRTQLAAAEARTATTQDGLTSANDRIIAAEAQLEIARKALEEIATATITQQNVVSVAYAMRRKADEALCSFKPDGAPK